MTAGWAMAAAVLALQGDAVAPVRADLAAGYRAAQELGGCLERRPGTGPAYETAMTRFWTVYARAEALFGAEVGAGAANAWTVVEPAGGPACDAAFVDAAAARAEQAFAAADARLDGIEGGLERGLWVGLFPLCADTVRSARLVGAEAGAPAAEIVVARRHAGKLRAYSKRFVRGDVAARPTVRLNGVALTTPADAPAGPTLTLQGPSQAELAAAVAQARAACPAR